MWESRQLVQVGVNRYMFVGTDRCMQVQIGTCRYRLVHVYVQAEMDMYIKKKEVHVRTDRCTQVQTGTGRGGHVQQSVSRYRQVQVSTDCSLYKDGQVQMGICQY